MDSNVLYGEEGRIMIIINIIIIILSVMYMFDYKNINLIMAIIGAWTVALIVDVLSHERVWMIILDFILIIIWVAHYKVVKKLG